MPRIIVVALYKFVTLDNYRDMREPLLACCNEQAIKGSLLLANEGINGTIAGSRQGVDAVLAYLQADPRLSDLGHKESSDNHQPFYRMKVKLKKEIVTMGLPDIDPNTVVGSYVKPADWNQLISDPEVLLLDTRNDYEVAIGSFKNAVDPATESFREFPDFVRENYDPARYKKVAMFCTGGIRCEKASAYMLQQGFEEVYHLDGGILKYLEDVPEQDSLWQGECFVFDNRVAVDHSLEKGSYDMCHGCRRPINAQHKQSAHYEEGVCCPQCYEHLSDDQLNRFRERQKQMQLAKQRQQLHLGSPPPNRQQK